MPTKRTRISRPPERRITPQAVEAFRAGDHGALHDALGLKPWEVNPLDTTTDAAPAWAAGPYGDSWAEARALRRELERTARAE